jgi:NADPH:quinone reductase-like Zn-dependent oxidoreductase
MFGFKRPKHPFPGMELYGVVEAAGSDANRFKVGDAVFGETSDYGFGTLGEYICINESAVCIFDKKAESGGVKNQQRRTVLGRLSNSK